MASISGFTVVPYGSGALGTFVVPGTGVRLSVRREVAPLLIGLAADFHRTVEPLRPGWCWGHAPKKITGTEVWSRHAPGIAIDLNAPAHPMGRRNTFTPGERKALEKLLARYTHRGTRLFRWGGHYKTRADDMHFELIAPRAVCLAAVAALQAPPEVVMLPIEGRLPELRRGMRDPVAGYNYVWRLQLLLGVTADGDYGPATTVAVKDYYARRLRRTSDGSRVDAAFWRRLLALQPAPATDAP